MAPQNQNHPCDAHAKALEAIGQRLDDGDRAFKVLRRIEVAVCGDEELGIIGLVSLHKRVQSLERWRTWLLGAAAVVGFTLGTVIPAALQVFRP